jgi:hypothetical protein
MGRPLCLGFQWQPMRPACREDNEHKTQTIQHIVSSAGTRESVSSARRTRYYAVECCTA